VDFEYDWRPAKAASNLAKHGITFTEALPVLEDDRALTITDTESDETEARLVTIGMDGKARILVVVYVIRGRVIHIISARQATRTERRQYEEQL
jgi:uncharacterized DUF497 family protein